MNILWLTPKEMKGETKMEITYRTEEDYRIPNLLPTQEPNYHLGKYASLRYSFLWNHRKTDFINLLTTGKLNSHLVEIQRTAEKRVAEITKQMKKDMVTEIAATLAFSAIQNNDKIGVIFFSDRIEKFIPPKKGRKHILYIIRELLDFKPESKRTDIKMAVEYLTNVIKKRCVTFMMSDFIDDNDYRNALTIANRKHDIVAIQVYDRRLAELPDVGLMKVRDAETGHEQWIDTSSAKLRNAHHAWWKERQVRLAETFTKSNVDSVSVRTDQDYVKSLTLSKQISRHSRRIRA